MGLISSKTQEREELHAKHGSEAWQSRVLVQLDSAAVEATFGLLLVLDIVCVVIELVLEAIYPPCKRILAHCTVETGLGNSTQLGCVPQPDWLEDAHLLLSTISILVLLLFLAEGLARVAALGVVRYLGNPLYLLDMFIVVASLVLELISRKNTVDLDAFETIILVRLWRLLRIGYSVYEDTARHDSAHVAHLQRENKRLEDMLRTAERVAGTHGVDIPTTNTPLLRSTADLQRKYS
mmetsp:Transcript_10109/g.16548  ORF Transcript_10109/g.16548 Transcript_10109/m.16548 type:complete len:237 (+) Transcript_10109:104-814(+)